MGNSTIRLENHPNYKQPIPTPQLETPIAFALRCAAHLISPPKEDGEDDEISCEVVAEQIIEMTEEIETAWAKHKK